MNLFAAIVVVTNIGYTAAFDTDRLCPSWVAYDLEPSEVVRTNRAAVSFKADARIDCTDLDEYYRGSGYDRGHLAPAADFNWSEAALRETYLYSNICPQSPSLNRGTWSRLEKELRTLAESGTVHIVTFPSLDDKGKIGRMSVPRYYIKIAYGYFGVRFWQVDNGE